MSDECLMKRVPTNAQLCVARPGGRPIAKCGEVAKNLTSLTPSQWPTSSLRRLQNRQRHGVGAVARTVQHTASVLDAQHVETARCLRTAVTEAETICSRAALAVTL